MLDARQQVITDSRPVEQTTSLNPRRFLSFALAFQDALLVNAALILAYWLRNHVQVGSSTYRELPFSDYQGLAVLLLTIMMPALFIKGAYRKRLGMEGVEEAGAITGAATLTIACILVITYMLHLFAYSRGVIVYLWVLLIVLPVLGRMTFRGIQAQCFRRGWGVRRLLVVGGTDSGKMIMQAITNRPDLGYQVIGFVDRRDIDRVPGFGRFPRLGTMEDLPHLVATHEIDEVAIALPGSAHEQLRSIVNLCEHLGVGLKLVPDLFSLSLGRVRMDDIVGIPLLDVQERPLRMFERGLKRALDIVVGMVALAASTLILGVLAALIKLDSPGPIFIGQQRVGRNGQIFTCWKLRTMYQDADTMLALLQDKNEAQGPIFKMRNDPRCTRVGRYIRRFSLDELPQIWNVVRGEMSLVGPRPPLPREVQRYEPWQLRRLEVTPGITGIWQVSGRSHLSFEEMVMMDITYIDNWSLGLDIKVLLRTISAVLAARGAY